MFRSLRPRPDWPGPTHGPRVRPGCARAAEAPGSHDQRSDCQATPSPRPTHRLGLPSGHLHPSPPRRARARDKPPQPQPTRSRDPDNTGTSRLWPPIARPPGAPRSRVGANQSENRYRVHRHRRHGRHGEQEPRSPVRGGSKSPGAPAASPQPARPTSEPLTPATTRTWSHRPRGPIPPFHRAATHDPHTRATSPAVVGRQATSMLPCPINDIRSGIDLHRWAPTCRRSDELLPERGYLLDRFDAS